MLGLGPYAWLRSYAGQWGIDWVTAAWAVVFSEVLGDWVMGAPDSDEEEPLLGGEHPQYGSLTRAVTEQSAAYRSRSRSLRNFQAIAPSRSIVKQSGAGKTERGEKEVRSFQQKQKQGGRELN